MLGSGDKEPRALLMWIAILHFFPPTEDVSAAVPWYLSVVQQYCRACSEMPSKIASVQHSRGKSYQLREELPGGSVVETPQSPLEKQQLSLLLPCPSLSVWLHQPQESGCPLVSVCFSGHQLLHGPCRCSALVLGSVCCSRPRLPAPPAGR